MYKRGEIVLIPVPFSDLQSSKKRPVIVISNDEYNGVGEDIIVAAITSNIRGLDNEVVFDSEGFFTKSILCESRQNIYIVEGYCGKKIRKFKQTHNRSCKSSS